MITRKRLDKIRRAVEEFAQSPQGRKSTEFVALAKKVGRVKSNRGKEPTYVRTEIPPFQYPLSIPQHPGDMPVGTAKSIIQQLLDDVDVLQQWFDQHEHDQENSVGTEQNDDADDAL